MVEKNGEYTVEITAVSSDGSGVGHIGGFTVFVPYTVPGDRAEIILEDVKPRFGRGRLMKITEPSRDRVNPECPAFGRCGGCQLRQMSYAAELREKRGIIENALWRIGGFGDFALDGITGMENPNRYRNKTVFHTDADSVACGFFSRRTHSVIPLEDCAIGAEENGKIIRAVTEYMRENRACAPKRVFTRKSFSSGEIMVVLSLDGEVTENIGALAEKLRTVGNITSIAAETGGKIEYIWGKERIEETLCGIKFEISAESFFQVNPVQTEKLYNKALEYAAVTGGDTVMDIYCGIGTLSLCAAKRAKKVIGVEISERAVKDARENAEKNGIKNAEFYADSAENAVPALMDAGESPRVVILDPPRKGSDEKTLAAIAKAAPERIVYVSCNPATLARDAKFLSRHGYKITAAHGFDLFPRTMHVETVMLLERSE